MTGRQIRAYLPATFAALTALRRQREVPPGEAYAVTAELRAVAPGEDEEALEYEAFGRAADAALVLLRGGLTPPRRVVIAVDVPAAQVAVPGPAPVTDAAAVRLVAPVPLARVAAIHVDGAPAQSAVAAALDASDGAEVELDDELEWYDVSELDQLVPEEAG